MTEERSHKSYRPFTVLTFKANFLLHELNPFGYHAVNILLHTIVVLLFYKLCLCYLHKEAALLSAMLFSAHPVHTEAVTGVVGRAELLSSVMFLSAVLLYMGALDKCHSPSFWVDIVNILIVGFLICVGTFSKEQCITVFGVFVAYELFKVYQKTLSCGIVLWFPSFKKKTSQKTGAFKEIIPRAHRLLQLNLSIPSWTSYAPVYRIFILFLFVIAVMFARIRIMGGQLPHFTEFDNPAAHAPR
uniref:Uncharacterized protein n=1 Tax=Trichobilharzia regenti TaxID=157069 RepID=A0AA85KBL8_TRIRE|nr:unnamed protein product [Trichobilharzia regenti]